MRKAVPRIRKAYWSSKMEDKMVNIKKKFCGFTLSSCGFRLSASKLLTEQRGDFGFRLSISMSCLLSIRPLCNTFNSKLFSATDIGFSSSFSPSEKVDKNGKEQVSRTARGGFFHFGPATGLFYRVRLFQIKLFNYDETLYLIFYHFYCIRGHSLIT